MDNIEPRYLVHVEQTLDFVASAVFRPQLTDNKGLITKNAMVRPTSEVLKKGNLLGKPGETSSNKRVRCKATIYAWPGHANTVVF